jgi:protein SCO1/2
VTETEVIETEVIETHGRVPSQMNLPIPNLSKSIRAALAVAAMACTVGVAHSQINDGVPKELEGIDIIERLDNSLPLQARFLDDSGKPVELAQYFTGKKPVLLQLGYNKCPMLCNLVLNGAFEGLKGVDWTPGQEFEVISVSIDPTEAPALAKAKKESYLAEFERPGAGLGVHFLTGDELMSKAVAESVGFKFRRQDNGEYSHAAVLILIKPDGKISRYMYGTKFEPKDIRFALLEASEGRIGSALDKFILWCHMYDPNARGYVLQARRVMSLGGAVTVVVLAVGLGLFWRADLKKKTAATEVAAAN